MRAVARDHPCSSRDERYRASGNAWIGAGAGLRRRDDLGRPEGVNEAPQIVPVGQLVILTGVGRGTLAPGMYFIAQRVRIG
jgi:hypothetical protein